MIKTCDICGSKFEIRRYNGGQKRCSPECMGKARLIQNKSWHKRHPGKHTEYSKRWASKRGEHLREYCRRYRKRNRQRLLLLALKRRQGRIKKKRELLSVLRPCAYCNSPFLILPTEQRKTCTRECQKKYIKFRSALGVRERHRLHRKRAAVALRAIMQMGVNLPNVTGRHRSDRYRKRASLSLRAVKELGVIL